MSEQAPERVWVVIGREDFSESLRGDTAVFSSSNKVLADDAAKELNAIRKGAAIVVEYVRPATAQQREGFVLVPVEPTKAMMDAAASTPGIDEINGLISTHAARTGTNGLEWGKRGEDPPLKQAWKAMLAAAPTPPPDRAPGTDFAGPDPEIA